MDPINTQKLQSTKNYKKFKFLSALFLHSVLALIRTLFCSYTFWFPLLCSSINSFSFVSLLNFNKSFFFNPKFLYIVGNAIIVFLIGESKLLNSSSSPATEINNGESKLSNPSSSPATEIYNECVQKSFELSRQMEKNEEQNLGIKIVREDSVKMIEKDAEEREEEAEESGLETEEEEEESGLETEEREEEEEESGLETEELNKRVEDFIARVKRQRLAEARFEDCGR
ncbi:hypothetical protein Vadar_014380 [Vaccinium darrowii]|uniref:Uncharacterized protein n=1 Tax=Vaccinium darrowii TaxID=229202 RepID=A0ACB7X0K8_9ERIC|nr:hypothetical protein Vadar_014380 [Vaccinium darrowii]